MNSSNSLDSSPVYAGTKSYKIDFSAPPSGQDSKAYFTTTSFNTSGRSYLSFAYYRGGSAPASGEISTTVYVSGVPRTSVDISGYATGGGGGWYLIQIPLTAMNSANSTINGLHLFNMDRSNQAGFNVDNLRFTNGP